MILARLASRVLAASLVAGGANASPLTSAEVASLCADADGPAHCARRVEDVQLKRLPNLATRDGSALKVTLYPAGVATFADTEARNGGRSYSLWDFVNEINAVVLFTTDGDDASFTLLLRASGRSYELPAEPKVSPDRRKFVTADFCATRCANELAVWNVTREFVRKDVVWRPVELWTDAVATWKDGDTISVEYTRAGDKSPNVLERRLGTATWSRVPSP
jgi:hypothetical protein